MRSILGRFLEHSRVYRFGADPETAEYLIGSADLMPRNLDHRVEALVPVTDPRLRARLAEMLELDLADDMLAWELARRRHLAQDPDGRRRLHAPRAPGAGDRSGAQLLTTAVGNASSHERELKFTPGSVVPRCPLFDGDEPPRRRARRPIRLHAAYFDTADLRLARAGASLRFRNDEGWTVKLPVSSRRRAGPLRDPPRRRTRRSARRSRSTSCTRSHVGSRSRSLRGSTPCATASCCATPTATQLAELVDDEVSVLDGARLAARFRELEVEFADAAPAELVDARRRPAARRRSGRARADPEDRARPRAPRARPPRPRRTRPSSTSRRPRSRCSAPPSRARRARLISHDPGVRTGEDPEAVHQARVATRRLRSDLRTFHTVVDPRLGHRAARRAEVAGRVCWARSATTTCCSNGSRRVSDELPPPTVAAGKRLLDGSARAPQPRPRRAARRDAIRALRRAPRPVWWPRRAPIPSSGDGIDLELELGDLVRKPWKKLRKAVRALDDDPPDEELHAVRIRAKRCRYAAEAVAPGGRQGGQAIRRGGGGRAGGARRAPGRGRRRAVAARPTRADGGGRVECAFVAGRARRARGRRRGAVARPSGRKAWKQREARELRQVDVSQHLDRARRRRHRAPAQPRRRRRRCCSCTARATTTGACPRARPTPASATRRPRCARSRRRRAYAVCSANRVGETRYRDSKGRDKVVHYWLMAPADGRRWRRRVRAQPRGRRVRWCTVPEAAERLSYAHDRKLLQKAPVPE